MAAIGCSEMASQWEWLKNGIVLTTLVARDGLLFVFKR